ncbi:hypothetical protein D3C73_948600 [compost metagenome]
MPFSALEDRGFLIYSANDLDYIGMAGIFFCRGSANFRYKLNYAIHMGVVRMPSGIVWFFTAFLVVWTGAAVFAAIKPRTFWQITQGWKAFREPPRAYFVISAIGAAVLAAVGLMLLLPLFTGH